MRGHPLRFSHVLDANNYICDTSKEVFLHLLQTKVKDPVKDYISKGRRCTDIADNELLTSV